MSTKTTVDEIDVDQTKAFDLARHGGSRTIVGVNGGELDLFFEDPEHLQRFVTRLQQLHDGIVEQREAGDPTDEAMSQREVAQAMAEAEGLGLIEDAPDADEPF